MIRITDRFTLRRVDGFLNVAIDGGLTVLNASQARDAAEAFNVMAVLMEADGDVSDVEGKEKEVVE